MDILPTRWIPDVLPGFALGDVAVGAVGQGGDLAHRPAHVAAFVAFGEPMPGLGHGCPQSLVLHVRCQQTLEVLADEAGAAGGDIDHLAHQIGVHPLHEVVEIDVHVVAVRRQLGGVVVAQALRIKVVQISAGVDERAPGFGHPGARRR